MRGALQLVLTTVRLDRGQSLAKRKRVAGAYYAALYFKAMFAPFTIALLGTAIMMTSTV